MTSKTRSQGKILFKILGVMAGLVFLIYGFVDRSDINKVKKIGRPAIVAPITAYTEMSKSGSSLYTAEFRFKTEAGTEVVQKHSFPEELIADFKSGAPVRIFYMPNDPSTFVFEKEKPSWFLVIVGGALTVAALVLL